MLLSRVAVLATADEVAASQLKLPSPLFLSGVDDPSSNLLSRAFGRFNYTFASGGGSSAILINISNVSPTTVTCEIDLSKLLMVEDTPIMLEVAPASVLIQDTLAHASLSSPNNQKVVVSFTVDDFAGLRAVLQGAVNNATASVAVSGDPSNVSALGRILRRARRPIDLRALLNDRSSASGAVSLPVVTLDQMQPLSLALSADLAPMGLSMLAGTLPSTTVELVYQNRVMLSGQISASFPTRAAFAVDVQAPNCALFLSDALTAGKSPSGLLARGAASTAASHVIQRLLDGLSYSLESSGSSGSAPVSLSAISIAGDKGSAPETRVVVDLSLAYKSTNSFLRASLPAVAVALRVNNNLSATIFTPALSLAPNTPFPPLVSIEVLAGPGLSQGVDLLLQSSSLAISVRGPDTVTSANVLQSIVNALPFSYNMTAPTGKTTGVLPQVETRLVSSSATQLSVGVVYPFSLNSSFEIALGIVSLSAVYNSQTIATVTVSNDKLVGGSNRLDAVVSVRAETPAARIALETFASAAFQGDAAPLTIQGVIAGSWYRFSPISFRYDFVLPKNAGGGSSRSSLLPCIDVGLTTPFDSSWQFGRCLLGCACTGTSRLCRTGPSCDSVSVLSRCVNLQMSIISHFYVRNILPMTITIQRLVADILFDFRVAQQSSFSNLRDTPSVLLAALDSSRATSNAILNTMPIVLTNNASSVISAWLRNSHLAVPPPVAFDPSNPPMSLTDTMLTGVLFKEAYENSDKVPLVFQLRNGAVSLLLDQFPFVFRFALNFTYITTSIVPDFITNHSLVCPFVTNKRPPCWLSTGAVAPNCYVDQFDGPCIRRGSPLSDCDAGIVQVLGQLLPQGRIGDMCCRDMILDGVKFPKISTLCECVFEEFCFVSRRLFF